MQKPVAKPSYTILVVDDLEDNRDLLSQWLERHGYTPVTASSGNEALELLISRPVDLVLLDIHMPRMDGFEFLQIIRSNERLRSTPVICLTAHFNEPSQRSRGLTFASAYFTKPFSFEDLRTKMEVVLKSRRPMDSSTRLRWDPPA